ncbi:MAG: hypothetical protein P8M25_07315 [Paracoccaceae bacterium]|nr:hypothetical protein [Paracoccaceae bacterium]
MLKLYFQVVPEGALLPHRTVLDTAVLPLERRGISKNLCHDKAGAWLECVGLGGFKHHHFYPLTGSL